MNRPRTCEECPMKAICKRPEGPGLPPGNSDRCRTAWQDLYEWFSRDLLDGLEKGD